MENDPGAQKPTSSVNRDTAARLAAQGLFVFPCGIDKKPLCKWRDVSTKDPSGVTALWRKNPGALPAIDCGKSGLVVFDCDRHDGPDGVAAFDTFVHGEIFPVTVETPRNGRHVYFRQPDGEAFGNRTGTLPKGIDVRGDGGYVIAPGAQLPNGRTYACDDFDVGQIPAMPDDLAKALQNGRPATEAASLPARPASGSTTPYGEKALRDECARVAAAIEGERNITLNKAAFAVGQLIAMNHLDEADARARLEGAAAACGLLLDEANRTITSGLDAGKKTPRLRAVDSGAPIGAPDKRTNGGTRKAVPFTTFSESCEQPLTKRWLLKEIVAKGESSAWIAPPGGGKSALLTEMAVAVASGKDWHGKLNKERCAVVYWALERADLVRRRLRAYSEKHGHHGLPIAVVGQTINLMEQPDTETVVATIKAVEERFGLPVGLVIFDTFAKMIAAGGGDENLAKDQGAVLANIGRIKEAVDVHVAIIGHPGKDTAKGARGSNAILGDVDVMVQISGDRLKTAIITKANDGPDGLLLQYRMEGHSFGLDGDGDPIDIGIVDPVAGQSGTFESYPQIVPVQSRPVRMSNPQRIALNALRQVIDESGQKVTGNPHIPSGVKSVHEDVWRERAYSLGLSSGGQDAKRKAFQRVHAALLASQQVATWNGYYWLSEDDLSVDQERDTAGQSGTFVPPCPGTYRDNRDTPL